MQPPLIFVDRVQAGQFLAKELAAFRPDNPVILALPRGGVPIAVEVAQELGARVEVLGVKKITLPSNPELAVAAVTEDGTFELNDSVIDHFNLSPTQIRSLIKKATKQAKIIGFKFRGTRSLPIFADKTVIVADDGLATGMTALATARFLKNQRAAKIIFAAPVCAAASIKQLSEVYHDVVCTLKPEYFTTVGNWYTDFSPVGDDEVHRILDSFTEIQSAGAA